MLIATFVLSAGSLLLITFWSAVILMVSFAEDKKKKKAKHLNLADVPTGGLEVELRRRYRKAEYTQDDINSKIDELETFDAAK